MLSKVCARVYDLHTSSHGKAVELPKSALQTHALDGQRVDSVHAHIPETVEDVSDV